MKPRIATVGDNCMDVYENTGRAYPGGNPVNVAVYFARMGGEASYTGVVGDDGYGRMMVDAIREKGVDVSRVRQMRGSTAITHVELVGGERVMGDYEEGVLANFALTPEDIDYLGAQPIVASALWGKSHPYFAEIRARGAKIAYDAAIRPWDPDAQAAIPNADYVFFSADGGDTQATREAMRRIFDQGPELVVATLGDRGSLAYDGREFTACGIVACPVVDTMGAGDSYIAGFLMGLAQKKPLIECMALGAQSAAVTIGYDGAW